ncbi:glycosyltransferase family 2 protein [Sphingomonas koreensis]
MHREFPPASGGLEPTRSKFRTNDLSSRPLSRVDANDRRTAASLSASDAVRPGRAEEESELRWTIVLAFYNEADIIVDTLRQLQCQTRSFRLVLVDNGSTDCSVALCHSILSGRGVDYVVVEEAEIVGQVAAIEKGLSLVDTEFVATCDADTFYPASYLANAEAVFDAHRHDTVAVSAYFAQGEGSLQTSLMAAHQLTAAWLLPRQTHVGGAGHCFRTPILKLAGGYSHRRWPYLLADHEIMHRVMKHGAQRLSPGHWCAPADRRANPMRWSLLERVGYHVTPFGFKERYFRWLARRFEQRGMDSARLRIRDWENKAE